MEHTRRSLLTGLVAFVAAPAIVRASSLMPIKPVPKLWVPVMDPRERFMWPTILIDDKQYRITEVSLCPDDKFRVENTRVVPGTLMPEGVSFSLGVSLVD